MIFYKCIIKTNFEGDNTIYNVKYTNILSDYFIQFGAYAANEIKINCNFSITNCE